MISAERVTHELVYASSVLPEVETTDASLAKAIEWADAYPTAWRIVTTTKSAVFGKNSSEYMGCQRGDSPSCALERVAHFMDRTEEPGWFGWRARFTLTHFRDAGFAGGFLQQFDGEYPRGCAFADWTPGTLPEVVDEFLKWCDSGYRFSTKEVWLDDTYVLRRYDDAGKFAVVDTPPIPRGRKR